MADRADYVIIGGGIAGCSLAYFLAKWKAKKILLLEKDSLASKETAICPGGIRQQHTNRISSLLAKKSVEEFFGRLEEELQPEYPLPFVQSGYLFLAHTENTLEQYKKNVNDQNGWGVPARILRPDEVLGIVPGLNVDGLLGAAFCGEDGFLEDSYGVTQQLGKKIREMGGRILFEEAIEIKHQNGRVVGVQTKRGFIETGWAVNAAGCDSPQLSEKIGIPLPIEIQQRRLLYTTKLKERFLEPLVVAFDRHWAGKQLSEGNVYMGYLREGEETLSDREFTEKAVDVALQLMPSPMSKLGALRVQQGRYDTTPDGQPLLGEVPELQGYVLLTGFSGHGYMLAPAAGMVLSEILTGHRPSLDIQPLRPNRFDTAGADRDQLVI